VRSLPTSGDTKGQSTSRYVDASRRLAGSSAVVVGFLVDGATDERRPAHD